MTQQDDKAWVKAAVERYEAPLVRYAAAITGDLDRARDVVQDTFLRLCREERARVDGFLARWLFTVCRNRAFDVVSKETRMKPTEAATMDAIDQCPSDPVAMLQTKESAGRAWGLMAELPRRQQQVLLLKFKDGLSYREISDAMGITVNHVGVLIHTAIQGLRRRLT